MYAISSNLKEFLRTKKVFSTHPTNFQLKLIWVSKNICHSVRFSTVLLHLTCLKNMCAQVPILIFFTAPSVSPLRDKIIFLLRFSRPISTHFPNHCKHILFPLASLSLSPYSILPYLLLTILLFLSIIFFVLTQYQINPLPSFFFDDRQLSSFSSGEV